MDLKEMGLEELSCEEATDINGGVAATTTLSSIIAVIQVAHKLFDFIKDILTPNVSPY